MKVARHVLPIFAVAVLAVLTGCPNGNVPSNPVTGMTVRLGANVVGPGEILFIEEGRELNLTVALEPAGITGVVTWSPADSENLGIETSNNGANATLEGLEPANEAIVVTVSAGNSDNSAPVTQTFYVMVVPEGEIPILGISIVGVPNGGSVAIFDGEERTLRVTLSPLGVSGTLSVTPSGSAFVDIDVTGDTVTLTGAGAGGPLELTVSATNDNTVTPVSTSFALTVMELPPPPTEWFQRRHNNFEGSIIYGVVYGGPAGGPSGFFAGADAGRIGVSDNSMVWTGLDTGLTPNIRGIAYGNGRIVAGLQSLPSLAVSADGGATWTHPSTTVSGFLSMGSDGGQVFVGGGFSGHIGFSENGGVTWWTGGNVNLGIGDNNVRGVAIGNGIVVAVGDGTYAQAFSENNGRTWTAGTRAQGTTANLQDVAFGRGRFVAVGNDGQIAWSIDGRVWTAAENTGGLTGQIWAVAYGNGYFVAGGAGGRIAWSTDGSNWVAAESPLTTQIWGLGWGGDKWVAVGAGGAIAFSGGLDTVENPIMAMEVVNADTGAAIPEGTSFRLREGVEMNLTATIDSDEIVADGDRITGTVTWISSDNNAVTITETPGTYGTGAVLTATARGSAYVTVSAQNDFNVEPVLLTFEITVLGDEDPFPVESIILRDGNLTVSDGGRLTLDLNQTRTFYVELYPTGVEGDITWSAGNADVSVVPGDDGAYGTITGLTAGGYLEITVTAENVETPELVTLTFTVNVIIAPSAWSSSESGADIFGALGHDGQSVTGVAFGNGVWVAGGAAAPEAGLISAAPAGSARMAWSIDGRNWTRSENDGIVVCTSIRSVNFIRSLGESGLFIAGGSTGRLYTSADGRTWTAMNDNQQIPGLGVGIVSSMTYANGMLFSTNTGNPRASFSDDGGATWTGVIPAADGGLGLWDGTYGNGVWVAVGNPGIIRHSTNLTDWTLATHPAAGVNLQGVAYGNGRFVAVGLGGNIVWSYDGADWTAATSGTSANLNAIVFANGYFVAVGDSNNIRVSADGVNWTAGTTPGANNAINPNLRDVAFGDNLWVTGGRGANLRFSDVAPAP